MYQLIFNVISVTALILGLFWTWFQWKHRRVLALARKLPIPLPAFPVLGHLPLVLLNYTDAVIKYAMNYNMKMKTVPHSAKQFCLWMGPLPLIFIQSPDDIQILLSSPKSRNKAEFYEQLDFLLKDDILTAEAHIWKPIRRFLLPLVHQRNIDFLMPIFNTRGRELVSYFSQTNGKSTDVLPINLQLMANNAFYLVHGSNVKLDPAQVLQTPRYISLISDTWMLRMIMSFVIPWNWLRQVLSVKFTKYVNKFFDAVNDQIIQKYQETSIERKVSNDSANSEGLRTLLDLYASAKDPDIFDELSLRKNIKVMLAAATDTTGITLSSCLFMLAMFPHYQEKVYQEILSSGLLEDPDTDITTDDIKTLTYLDQFIKETTRLFPIFPIIGRKVTEDLELSFGTVPANTSVFLVLHSVHLDPDIYPDPYVFNPDRFSQENQGTRHKYSHLPFSGGARNCLGKDYAIRSIKTAIIHVVRQFKLKTTVRMEDIEFIFKMEMMKKNGYPIYVETRSTK